MAINPLVVPDAGLAASQDSVTIELNFVGVAPGNNGVKLALVAPQSSAGARVHLAVGGAVDSTSALPTAAAVQALIKRPNGDSLSAQELLIASGVESALGEIETIATDGNDAAVFALGGLNASEVLSAELEVTTSAGVSATKLIQVGPAVRIPEPVALVGGKLKKANGNALDLDADKLALVGGLEPGSAATIVGCVKVTDVSALGIVAGTIVKLKLHVKH